LSSKRNSHWEAKKDGVGGPFKDSTKKRRAEKNIILGKPKNPFAVWNARYQKAFGKLKSKRVTSWEADP